MDWKPAVRSRSWASATVLFATGGIVPGEPGPMPKNQPATAASSAATTSRTIHSKPAAPGVALRAGSWWAWRPRAGAPSPRPAPACAGRVCWAHRALRRPVIPGAVLVGRLVRGGQRPVSGTPRGAGHHGGRVAAVAGDHLGGPREAAVDLGWHPGRRAAGRQSPARPAPDGAAGCLAGGAAAGSVLRMAAGGWRSSSASLRFVLM